MVVRRRGVFRVAAVYGRRLFGLFCLIVVGGSDASAEGWEAIDAFDDLERCKLALAEARGEIAGLRSSPNQRASGRPPGGGAGGQQGRQGRGGGRADSQQWNPVTEHAKLAHDMLKKAYDDIMDDPDAEVDVEAAQKLFKATMDALERISGATTGGGNDWSEEYE